MRDPQGFCMAIFYQVKFDFGLNYDKIISYVGIFNCHFSDFTSSPTDRVKDMKYFIHFYTDVTQHLFIHD